MARVFALTQGLVPNHDHEHAVSELLCTPNANDFFISVAFVREGGVSKIEPHLRARSDVIQIFVGIANGITSHQALAKLLDAGIYPFLVDMGTQASIFHPKLYAAIGTMTSQVILGSANLTSSGLSNNIEASSLVELDMTNPNDRQYIADLLNPFRALIGNYPNNIFQVTTKNELDILVSEGRLEDESVKKLAPVVGTKSTNAPPVATPAFPIYRRIPKVVPPPPVPVAATPPLAHSLALPVVSAQGLVWSSKELSERDLSIPTGSNTNPTGSMYFKKGLLEGIDQRNYFKEIVFAPLIWSPDPRPNKRHLLRSEADFEIIINGISNGVFTLQLTHNSLTDTPTYRQNNAMTQVHWGYARSTIAQRGLLHKHMSLYHLGGSYYQMTIT
jgi:HKD family nuclease